MQRKTLSVQEASKILNVSVKTLHRWEKSGILIPRRTSGKHRRYSQEQISNLNRKKYSREQKTENPSTPLKASRGQIAEDGIQNVGARHDSPEFGIPHVFSEEFRKANLYLSSLNKKRENIKPFFRQAQDLLSLARRPLLKLEVLSLSQRRIIVGNLTVLIFVLSLFGLSRLGVLGESFKAPIPKGSLVEKVEKVEEVENGEFLQPNRAVLAESTVNPNFVLNVNVPSIFHDNAEFLKDLTVQGKMVLTEGIEAPNVINSLTAGSGLSLTGGTNTPTIANSGVLSFQSKTGAVTLTAGTGITIDGTKITNSSPDTTQNTFKTITVGSTSFSAGSSTDTLTLAAGTGITITSDTTNKKLTLSGSSESGWTDGGTSVYLTTLTDSVGIGTITPSYTLDVAGSFRNTGNAIFGDDSSDTLTFNGRSASSIVPSTDLSYDLGSSSLRWSTIYANSVIGGGSGTQGHWQRASGVISPANITDDLVIGATASSSAVFQVIGTGSNAGNTTIKGKTQLGDATGDTISIYGYITAGDDSTGNAIEPSTGSKFDIGSSSRTWRNLYVDTITATGTTLSGTNSDDFRINADYTGDDGESSTLSFERGSPATNAVFKWNATGTPSKLFSLNAPLFINPDSGITYSGTSALIVNQIQAQDIFTASASGSTKFKIDVDGNIVSVAGAKWQPLTDSTTALNIASSNGTSFVTFDTSNSRVGIGTTAPLTALAVTGSASLSANLSLSGAGTAHTFNVLDGGTLNVQRSVGGDAGVASSLFIDASGNVGIGTSAPAEKLEVSGNIKPTASTNNLGTVSLDTTADVTFSGGADSDNSGTSVANAGDVNGDGYQDIIVGAVGAEGGGTNRGQAYIYYGGSTVDTTADVTLSGDTDNKNFGRSVAGAGDVNGDGFDDVIVGQTSNSVDSAGKVFVFYGGASMDTTADMTYTGTGSSINLGYSVSFAGDVNGDGYSDVIAGAYYTSPSELLPTAGEAYIFLGGPSFDNTVDVTLQGADGDQLGYSVASAGDVNGDGYSDVIIGAYASSSYIGAAYVFYGGANMNTAADVTISGAAAADRMGASVSGAGDVNGDGYSDVIVGAIYADAGGTNRGRAYVFYGGASMNNTADVTISGGADNDELGEDVGSAGDVNGDGYSDVIVGAKKADSGGTDRGQAYVYYGGSSMDNTVDVTFSGATNSDNLGEESTAGDFNGDGYIDVIAGTPGAEGAGTNRGQAYIYQGSGGRWLSSFAQNINLSRGLQIAGLAFDKYKLSAGGLFGISSTNWEIDKLGTASFQDLVIGNTASASGNLSFSGARTIASTAMNTLTIGDSSTGNLIINPGGNIGIGNTTPLTKLDVTGSASVSANLSLSGADTAHTFNILQNGTLNFQNSVGGDGGLATALFIQNNGRIGIGTTAPGGRLDITDTSNTAASFSLTNNTATTIGNGANTLGVLDLQSTSLTTGNFMNIELNALSSGKGINLTSTSTALSSGSLAVIDWSPSGSTNIYATGDILSVGTGNAYAFSGNLLNVKSQGSSVFSVSDTAVTSSLPTSFTASGDVAVAYDLNFTNPTVSYIKSSAPLYIQAGEVFNSSDLNLSTYHEGSIVLTQDNQPTAAATSYAVQILPLITSSTNSLTYTAMYGTYNLADVNLSGNAATDLTTLYSNYTGLTATAGTIGTWYGNYVAAPTGSGTVSTAYGMSVAALSNATSYGLDVGALSGATANYGVNIGNITSAAAANNFGLKIGTITSQASATSYGISTGAISGGGTATYGINLGANSSTATTNYGINIGAISGAGTTNYGLYVGAVSGATSNYAAIFAGGNVGIGNTTPLTALDVTGSASLSANLSLRGDGTAHTFNILQNGTLNFQNSVGGDAGLATALFVQNNSAIGMGTTSPSHRLQISNAGDSGIYLEADTDNVTEADNPYIKMSQDGGARFNILGMVGAADKDPENVTYTGTLDNATLLGTLGADALQLGTNANARLTIDSSGFVGIGTTTPAVKFDVADSRTATVSALISNTNTGTDSDVLALKLGFTGGGNTGNNFITFLNGNGDIHGKINSTGSSGVGYQTSGIDFAEYFRISQINADQNTDSRFGPRTLVCLSDDGGVAPCDSSNTNILGVVSKNPGFVGGLNHENDPNYVLVGLVGQVPVKISTESGVIKPGDALTISSVPGVAQKATKKGYIVGRALESCDSTCEVMISLNPSWYDPSIYIAEDGNLNVSSSMYNVLSIPDTDIASFSAKLNSYDSRIINLEDKIASLSALINTQPFQSTESATLFSDLSSINEETATISGSLTVLGRTVLSDVGITGNIQSGLLSINGLEGEINTVGSPLKLQALGIEGIEMIAGKIKIDTNGNIETTGVVAGAKFAVDTTATESASLGNNVLLKNKTSITIDTSSITDKSKIFLTPNSSTGGQSLIVSKKTQGKGFEVSIDSPVSNDIKFDWFVVDEK